mmetsp:Transcript_8674/g.24200  ORF Transcript_8674/g.24200 Transcript_8674/m.24200 type:complete len:238 (+) Transcript_8674:2557-3270(+)
MTPGLGAGRKPSSSALPVSVGSGVSSCPGGGTLRRLCSQSEDCPPSASASADPSKVDEFDTTPCDDFCVGDDRASVDFLLVARSARRARSESTASATETRSWCTRNWPPCNNCCPRSLTLYTLIAFLPFPLPFPPADRPATNKCSQRARPTVFQCASVLLDPVPKLGTLSSEALVMRDTCRPSTTSMGTVKPNLPLVSLIARNKTTASSVMSCIGMRARTQCGPSWVCRDSEFRTFS